MSVSEATGDIFDYDTWTIFGSEYPHPVDSIGHGVNCMGAMGSGIAVEFKRRYPMMYNKYNKMCMRGDLLPGMMMPWRAEEGLHIFNIASQFHTGRDGNLDYLHMGLLYSRFYMQQHDLKHLALPRIGCGIAGLDWDEVKEVIQEVFTDESGNVDNMPHVTLVSLEG